MAASSVNCNYINDVSHLTFDKVTADDQSAARQCCNARGKIVDIERRPHTVPKKLHFIHWNWGKDGIFLPGGDTVPEIPTVFAWAALNEDFTSHVWSRDESYDFVRDAFPTFWPIFESYARNIQRCDVFRILLLAKVGGVYADTDTEARAPLNQLLETYQESSCIFATERILPELLSMAIGRLEPIRQRVAEHRHRVANYWIASSPHSVLDGIIDEFICRSELVVRRDYDVNFTTGPDVVTTVVHREMERRKDITLVSLHEAEQYFHHQEHGSWRTAAKSR